MKYLFNSGEGILNMKIKCEQCKLSDYDNTGYCNRCGYPIVENVVTEDFNNIKGTFGIRSEKIKSFNAFNNSQNKDPFYLLIDEFDKFISITGEVPWWYNERACVSLFASSLVRKPNVFILEEHSCEKEHYSKLTKSHKKQGRTDLSFWIKEFDTTTKYIVEAKHGYFSLNDQSAWSNKIEKEALSQVKYYINGPNPDYYISIYFRSIYVNDKDTCNNFHTTIENNDWNKIFDAINSGIDFYGFYYLKRNSISRWLSSNPENAFKYHNNRNGDYFHIGVAISGIIESSLAG
jgi:hypothetical protein